MGNGEIDRLPVNQLLERYNLVRSAVYTRLEALGIKTERVGNRAYVNSEQLKLLDELHEFIQSGRTTAEFLESRGMQRNTESSGPSFEQSSEQSSGLSSGLSSVQPELVRLVAMISAEIASRVQPPAPDPDPDPFAYFEVLERACQNGWLLSSLELAELLNLSLEEIRSYGDRFSEAGFVFTQAGFRAGGEVAWKVSKPVK